MSTIYLHNVSVCTDGHPVLKRISFRVEAGELAVLRGRSGSGKSTLIRLLSAQQPPDTGSVEIGGFQLHLMAYSELPSFRCQTGFVAHSHNLLMDSSLLYNCLLALDFSEEPVTTAGTIAVNALTEAGFEDFDRPCELLNNAELMRASLVVAAIRNPSVIIIDDPLRDLENRDAHQILDLIQQFRQRGATILVASNNQIADSIQPEKILLLNRGDSLDVIDRRGQP